MFRSKDYVVATVSTGYDASATSIVLTTGHGARFDNATPSVAVWYNHTDYPSVWDDPNVETILVRSRSTDTLTVMRAWSGPAASTKNTGGKTYRIMIAPISAVVNHLCPRQISWLFDDFEHGSVW